MATSPDKGGITQLLSVQDLVDQLMAQEAQAKKPTKEEIVNKKRSRLGSLFMIGAASLLTYALTSAKAEYDIASRDSVIAQRNAEIDFLKNCTFTGKDIEEYTRLDRELNSQLKETNDYLAHVEAFANDFGNYAAAAKKYIANSTPRGELEESVAKEVESLNGFFDSCSASQEAVLTLIGECYATSQQSRGGSSKSESRELVDALNARYIAALDAINGEVQGTVEQLNAFKAYAAKNPLRQSKAMVAQTQQQIAGIEEMAGQLDDYKGIFAGNTESDGIIPVTVRVGASDDVAMTPAHD